MQRANWIAWVAVALVSAWAEPGHAQAGASELRARAERVTEARPDGVPRGSLVSVSYLLDVADRIERRFPTQAGEWRRRAERFLGSIEGGRDPYPEAGGQILNRAYEATYSPRRQGYAIYIPEGYDPSRRYPLLVMLHGGSSLGNLFLGVVLGNNMDWQAYDQHLWDDYTPRFRPDFIVVAPDGVGQVMWRWMGEQDVLEVIDDVKRHYAVDDDRVMLGGLSNGGVGAYAIGTRHAWRFSHVHAIAGAPSWLQYSGGRPTEVEEPTILRWSGMHLVENTVNTDFRYYHGTQDPGPMRPAYVRQFTEHIRRIGLDPAPRERWYEHGHDLLYIVHRHGRAYPELAELRRNPSPAEVRLVSGDYRANRQHWARITRFDRYPRLGRVHARARVGRIEADTENVLELAFDLADAPLGEGAEITLVVDGAEVYRGPRAPLGHRVHLHRSGERFELGFLPATEGLEKVPGLAGPLTDAYHVDVIHVYGTGGDDRTTQTLRRTAERGARGWPLGVWTLDQRVVADTEVDEATVAGAHLALYGAPGENAILDRIAARLPIRVQDGAVEVGSRRFAGPDVGVRFIHPNPEAPTRYVVVQTGVSADAVWRGRNLPDFLPDYAVYDRRTTSSRPRLLSGRNAQLAAGYFDRFWRLNTSPLPPPSSRGEGESERGATPEGADDGPDDDAPGGEAPDTESSTAGTGPESAADRRRRLNAAIGAPPGFVIPPAVLAQTPPSSLPPGEVPAAPPRPRRFAAPLSDPAGAIARQIARAVPTFYNYRAIIPGGVWSTSPRAVFQIRAEETCLEALEALEVPHRRVVEALETPIPTPVEITGPVGGVRFRMYRPEDTLIVSCELATRLPLLARVVRRQGVTAITVLSAHRTRPRQSFHTMGMALDLYAFHTRGGTLSVNDHFVETPDALTCEADEPTDLRARALLRIACDLAATRRFNSILTPNYNDGHRNHFHLDIRPDDNRIFVR